VYAHINETDCRNAHRVHLASWVVCYRFNNSPLSMQVPRCVYSTQCRISPTLAPLKIFTRAPPNGDL